MNTPDDAFSSPDPSARLHAVLFAGLRPSLADLDTLIRRCAIEPDFQVREMLTWALVRLPAAVVVPRLIVELGRDGAQARSQALHTLSKIGDASAWPAVAARLDDQDPDVVRTAWYAAVAIAPAGDRGWLARKLAESLGCGGHEAQLSLSRALAGLGIDTVAPILAAAAHHGNEAVRKHAAATERLLKDPDTGFDNSLRQAKRKVALDGSRSTKG